MELNKCILLKAYSGRLLLAFLLLLSSVLSPLILPQTASASEGFKTPPYGTFDDFKTFLNNNLPSQIGADWENENYGVLKRDGLDRIFMQYGSTDENFEFTAYDEYPFVDVKAKVSCSWNLELTYFYGCSTASGSSLYNEQTTQLYHLHLTSTEIGALTAPSAAWYEANGVSTEPIVPRLKYSVDRYDLTASYERNLDLDAANLGTENDSNYKIFWTVYHQVDGVGETIFTYASTPGESFKYRFDEFGAYSLSATILWRGVPYPALAIPEADISPMFVNLVINGDTFEGDTGTDECTTTGGYTTCVAGSSYEDCSTYGADIVGGIGCAFRNFGNFLRILFSNMFVPRNGFLESQFSEFTLFMESKLGFIYQSIAHLVSLLGGIIVAAATPNPILNPSGTMFGQTVSFDISYLEDNWPAIWNLIIAIVRSATVLAMMFAFLRKYQEVVDHR